jgi:hypothetical protein
LEDTQYTFTAANFGFTDPNDSPANALTAVKITTIPGVGSLTCRRASKITRACALRDYPGTLAACSGLA